MIKKRLVGSIVALMAIFMFTSHAEAQLSKVCRSVVTVPQGGTYIYKNSAPLRVGGPGGTLTGFRREPTLIMNRNVSARRTTKVFDSRGKRIGSCPWATAIGHAGGRFRCTMQTTNLRRTAVRRTRNAQVYFLVNSRTKLCARIPDAGRCYGSVKGLCNQLIK